MSVKNGENIPASQVTQISDHESKTYSESTIITPNACEHDPVDEKDAAR